MPPHHYWHPRIYRPSYGPVATVDSQCLEYLGYILWAYPKSYRQTLKPQLNCIKFPLRKLMTVLLRPDVCKESNSLRI